MKDNPTWLAVVALCLTRQDGRILLQKRPLNKHHGGLWEFPGGKVEQGESPRNALCREIFEELHVTIDPGDLMPFAFAEEARGKEDGMPVVLFLYTSSNWQGDPDGREGQEWAWIPLAEAAALPLAPMDRHLLDAIERIGCPR